MAKRGRPRKRNQEAFDFEGEAERQAGEAGRESSIIGLITKRSRKRTLESLEFIDGYGSDVDNDEEGSGEEIELEEEGKENEEILEFDKKNIPKIKEMIINGIGGYMLIADTDNIDDLDIANPPRNPKIYVDGKPCSWWNFLAKIVELCFPEIKNFKGYDLSPITFATLIINEVIKPIYKSNRFGPKNISKVEDIINGRIEETKRT